MAVAHPVRPLARTLVIDSAGQSRRIAVLRTPFVIGRSDDCDAVIPDFRVSRLHAKIVQDGEQFILVDEKSRHGTFVNGSRCQRAVLKNGDEITLGAQGLKLTFVEGEPESSATNVLLSRLVADSDTSELEKLRLFLEATRSMGSGLVVNDVLRKMLDVGLRITRAERGFVYLKQKDGTPVLACGLDASGNQVTADRDVSHSVVQEALASAAEFITGDTAQQSALAARQSIVLNELRTVIAIPLRVRRLSAGVSVSASPAEVSGVLYLDSRSISRNLSGVSNDVLRALASECAAVLESAMLVESEQAARQYRQEMEIAAGIQKSLISASDVRCDFARVTGRSIPCKEVGGDFYDVTVSPQAVTIVVADVSGKGISAALLASVIHGMFYAQVSSGTSLLEAVNSVNSFLCSRVAGRKYSTLMAAQLDRGGTLRLVNCGHVPAMLVENGKVMQIEDGDMPVGLMPDATFHTIERPFVPGSRLLILTDGISETENAAGTEYGYGSLAHHLHSADPIAAILADVQSFSGNLEAQDDRTLVVLERNV